MSNFADFTTLTFVNGTTPAISSTNLNKNENYLENIGNELNYSEGFNILPLLRQGFQKNIKQIEEFDSLSGWTTSSGGSFIITDENSNATIGESNLQISDTDDTASILYAYRTSTAINLTTFNDGSTSDVDDYINITYYVNDSTKFSAIGLRLGTDSSNYYSTAITVTTGWNLATIKKSSFSSTGSPSWSNIPYLYVTITSTNNASSNWVWFNDITLVRDDSVYMNPFLYDNGSGVITSEPYIVSYTDSLITYDKRIGKLGWILTDRLSTSSCTLLSDVNSFSIKLEAYSKHSDDGPAVRWYINSSNYFYISVENNYLYLKETVSGVSTTVASKALNTIDFYDRMELYVDKVDNVIRASLSIDGQQPVHLDIETSFSATEGGSLGLAIEGNTQFYMITDLSVGFNMNSTPPFMSDGNKLFKRKKENESRSLITTPYDDDELFIKIPAQGIYKVTLQLAVDGQVDNTPDIHLSWDVTGDLEGYYSGFRKCVGPGYNSTEVNNAETMCIRVEATFSVAVRYGVTASRWASITEELIVLSGISGGKMTLNWSQYTSSVNFVKIIAGSYIQVDRIG